MMEEKLNRLRNFEVHDTQKYHVQTHTFKNEVIKSRILIIYINTVVKYNIIRAWERKDFCTQIYFVTERRKISMMYF